MPARSYQTTPALGRVKTHRRAGPFSVWKSAQGPGLEVAGHRHRNPTICFVLEGDYLDDSYGRWIGAGSAVLVPPGAGGRTRIGRAGSRCLVVEGSCAGLRELLGLRRLPSEARVLPETSGLATALSANLESSTAEELVERLFVLGAALAQVRRFAGPLPNYLRAAVTRLDEDLGCAWSLSTLAADVGVHRTTLARAFRRHLGTTPGEHLRGARLARALQLVAGGAKPTEVAAECGFSDQSHLTRLFKNRFGTPPGRLRRFLATSWDATEVQDSRG